MWSEGPLWWNNKLYFCDLVAGTISTIAPGETKPTVIRENADRPAGAALDREGRLLIAHFSGGQKLSEKSTGGKVTRTEADGKVTTVLDNIDGKALGPCNDLAVRTDGTIYTTDFGGAKEGRNIIRISPDGKATVLPSTFEQANGLALSPDEATLYVAEYRGAAVKAFDVAADGSLSNERVLVDLKSEKGSGKNEGRCDGLKTDEKGNIYTTGPGGIWVVSPKGEKLARLDVHSAANLAFGGADRKTLYICAGSKILSVRTKFAGAAPHAIVPSTPAAPAAPVAPAVKPPAAK
jgi:gluconolactonase